VNRRAAIALLMVLLGAATTKPAGVGGAVATFARNHRGQQVGDGECARLVEEALRAAGAQVKHPDVPDVGDYVWGELVVRAEADRIQQGKLADIRPGDLLQFRDAKFVSREGRAIVTLTFEHHSAVVDRVNPQTGAVAILHQNFNQKKTVEQLTIQLKDLKAGWVRVYRPTAEPRTN
jgi:hypothetical protein